MIRRFDIGWRDPSGNHGLIAAHDSDLSAAEVTPLLKWTDITRAEFRAHWFFVSLCTDTMALIRVSPIEGGTRGAASFSTAMLFHPTQLCWGIDLGALVAAFPPVPDWIGRPSAWQPVQEPTLQLAESDLRGHPELLAAVLGQTGPLEQCRLVNAGSKLTQEAQISIALRSFALLPRDCQAEGLCFASSDAPGYAKPFFGFSQDASQPDGALGLARFWLSLIGRIDSYRLSRANVREPASIFRWIAEYLAFDADHDVVVRVEALHGCLVAVSLGELDDAKLSAVEDTLARLAPSVKGEFLLILMRRLEAVPIPGVHPLWILRLVCDPDTLAGLSSADRQDAFQRFFGGLPNELDKVLPQLPDEFLSDLVKALCESLRARGAAVGDHPPGFIPLANSVLRDCLVTHAAQQYPDRSMTVLLALNIVQELARQRHSNASAVAEMAARLADDVVADPGVFGCNLLEVSKGIEAIAAPGVDIEPRGKLLRFLLHTSFAGRPNPQHGLESFLDALDSLTE